MLGPLHERVASRRADGGFTLVELLIVIVILGILAAVVVVAVSGITDRGQDEACNVDQRAVESSEEAAFAQTGHYMTEAQLVSNGYLRSTSALWDVTTTGTNPDFTAYNTVAADTRCA
jgi:general secretion pathway protein G